VNPGRLARKLKHARRDTIRREMEHARRFGEVVEQRDLYRGHLSQDQVDRGELEGLRAALKAREDECAALRARLCACRCGASS